MPYLSFSTQCAGTDDRESKDTQYHFQSSNQEHIKQGAEDVQLQRLYEERNKYQSLLSDHENQIIHRSPTLDEWYYHFDTHDPESTKDRDQRNESQVVHKYLPKGDKKQTHWPLIRVNQLWVWTLGNSMSP